MPDLYDRSTCATELRIRNEVIAKIRDGWGPVGKFQLPDCPSVDFAEDERSDPDEGGPAHPAV